MRMPSFNSLTARLVAIMSLWTLAGLLTIGIVVSLFYSRSSEEDFEQLLLAHAYNLMGAVEVTDDDKLTSNPNLGDPRFLTPGSGWYWTVSPASDAGEPLLASPSMSGNAVDAAPAEAPEFNDLFRRSYTYQDGNGQNIQRLEAQLYFGDLPQLFQVTIAANRKVLEDDINFLNFMLVIFLILYGLGTVVSVLLAVRFGLKPLAKATSELIEVRRGNADNLEGDFPSEIQPFVNATNDLIGANRSVIERARTEVGNLAHALKTPLAVIFNEVRPSNDERLNRIEGQASSMQGHVNAYLAKARVAAQRQTLTARTRVLPVCDQMIATFRKLNPDLKFKVHSIDPLLNFRGEEQDLQEILGNLLENAARHARHEVNLNTEASKSSGLSFTLIVEDDGPGIPEEQCDRVLERGKRLDETTPGSGLGLSIVNDIASDYGGEVELARSECGGLKVSVFLPTGDASVE